MDLTLPHPIAAAILLTLVLTAAVYDVRYRRIPNWLSVAGCILGVIVNPLLYGLWAGLRLSLLGFLTAFGIYVVLYALHAMGAGDVKLMAAVGALMGVNNWLAIFFFSALVGGLMALILVLRKRRVKQTFWNVGYILSQMTRGKAAYITRKELDVKHPDSLGLPHGAVIAVGTVFFLAAGAHHFAL